MATTYEVPIGPTATKIADGPAIIYITGDTVPTVVGGADVTASTGMSLTLFQGAYDGHNLVRIELLDNKEQLWGTLGPGFTIPTTIKILRVEV